MISFILAMDDNRVIGKDNQLPWHLPEDLKFFKRVTMGHPIVMGRKTYDSIGRPLPGRENIIITRNPDYRNEDCTVFNTIAGFLAYCKEKPEEEFFVIGGAEIFHQMMTNVNRLYITEIHEEFEGDTFFQEIDMESWNLISREKGLKDEKNPYDYEFTIYERK
jgi:dihydrofolate reductase